MSHRRAGVGAIQEKRRQREVFAQAGQSIQDEQLSNVKIVLSRFKSNLEVFAQQYGAEIRKDKEFRALFQKMCAQVGVDPLASNKGFWSELLGFGDFYYEVSVQVSQVCMLTRDLNGGLINLEELKRQVKVMRGSKSQDISDDDIIQSVKCLKILGSGFQIVESGERKFVQSVPAELNMDYTMIIALDVVLF